MTDAARSPASQFMADADMFTGALLESNAATMHAPAQSGGLLMFEGCLVRNAEVRTTTAADGLHSTPIVCLELRPINSHLRKQDHRICTAQIPFTDGTRSQAEACAKAHKKGMVITVASHLLHTRLVLPQAQIINAYTPTQAPT